MNVLKSIKTGKYFAGFWENLTIDWVVNIEDALALSDEGATIFLKPCMLGGIVEVEKI